MDSGLTKSIGGGLIRGKDDDNQNPLAQFSDADLISTSLAIRGHTIDKEINILVDMIDGHHKNPKIALSALKMLHDIRSRASGEVEARYTVSKSSGGGVSSFTASVVQRNLSRSKIIEQVDIEDIERINDGMPDGMSRLSDKLEQNERLSYVEKPEKKASAPQAIHSKPPENAISGGLSGS